MKHVALLIETSRAYGRELLLGVRRYMTEHNPWSVFVELRDLESNPPSWLANWDGDGILTRTGSQVMADAVTAVGVPTVELRATKLKHHFPFVGMDNRSIGKLCANYLAELGYRSFGVYGLSTEQFFEERCRSFTDAIEEKGFECQALQQTGNRERPEQWERQQANLVKWLKALRKPTAIMACTDQLGFWLLDACVRAEISVPEEIAVIGVENDETLCSMSSPPLSSVSLGGERVGYAAAALLDRMMKGRKAPKMPTLFEPKGIVARRSTDTVAISDPLLSQSMRMIREKASAGLRVADILEEIPISRSSLERGFRLALGRSPNEEINRVRLEHARELLIDTTLSLEQIAHRTGFAQAHYFCQLFAKTYGTTPGKFRKQRRSSEAR